MSSFQRTTFYEEKSVLRDANFLEHEGLRREPLRSWSIGQKPGNEVIHRMDSTPDSQGKIGHSQNRHGQCPAEMPTVPRPDTCIPCSRLSGCCRQFVAWRFCIAVSPTHAVRRVAVKTSAAVSFTASILPRPHAKPRAPC